MTGRPNWHDYGLALAAVVATRADCRRGKFGAVIMDSDHRIVATGYNGSPPGDARSCLNGDCERGLLTQEECPSFTEGNNDYSNCISLHAEQNAIANADPGRIGIGGIIYITGPPCDACSKLISAARIKRVVYP